MNNFLVSSALCKLSEFQNALYNKTLPIMGEEFSLRHKPRQKYIPASEGSYPESDTADLRQFLIEEESMELMDALYDEPIENVAKELADLMYVSLATAVLFDIPIQAVFNRVHDNNMLKLKNGTVDPNTGKLLKPEDHSKVNLKDLFDEKV